MSESLILRTSNANETEAVGEMIGKALLPGAALALFGELGAGKTTITKGVARGLGVSDDIHSPTFNLLHIHNGRMPLYHFDVYRLRNSLDMDDLGYEEYFYNGGATIIEWPEVIADILPEDRIDVHFTVDGDSRILEITATGDFSSVIVNTIRRLSSSESRE